LTMATFAIPQADKLCMDYEARMHSLLKSTLQEERERAAKHAEDSMVEQLSKERQLSYGLQEAAARNYRIRKSGQEEMNSMLAVVSREREDHTREISDLRDNLADLNAQLSKECIEKDQISAELSKSLNIRRQLEQELAGAATEASSARQHHANNIDALNRKINTLETDLMAARRVKTPAATSPPSPAPPAAARAVNDSEIQALVEAELAKRLAVLEAAHKDDLRRVRSAAADEIAGAVAVTAKQLEDAAFELEQEQALSKELNSQLRSIKLDLDMNSQSQRNSMAMARMELVGVEKREDLRNLQRVHAEATVEVVTKEAETMRRVMEAGLVEGNNVATMLKEQLDITRSTMSEQAVAAKQEVDTLNDSVADMQHRRNQLELDKFKSEQELEQRVAGMHSKAEDLQLGKEATTAELTDTQSQVARLREALSTSVREADNLSAELDESERKCLKIQRGAEMKVESTLREKQIAIAQMHAEVDLAKREAMVAHKQESEARDGEKRAHIQVTLAKHELGTALEENHDLKAERIQADVVMGVMGSQLREVESHSAAIADNFTIQANTASARLAESDRMNGRYRD